MSALRKATLTESAARAQNVDFLPADFEVGRADGVVRLSVAVSTAVRVLLVPSAGTALALNGGTALGAGAIHTFELVLDGARSWNLATDDASGTTVLHVGVLEVLP